jgi:chromosome segregation ATPase
MDIHLPIEFLAAIGVALGALILAILWLITKSFRQMSSVADALDRHAQVNAALNDELLTVIKERHAERETWDAAKQALKDAFDTHKQDCEQVNGQMSAELQKVRLELDGARNRIKALEREAERLRIELGDARAQIDALTEEGKKKDQRIEQLRQRVSELETRLARSEAARKSAEDERDRLAAQVEFLNGQHSPPKASAADIPDTTQEK